VTGFDNWKKGLEKFKSHEYTKSHREAMEKYHASKEPQVNSQLDLQWKRSQSERRIAFIKILSSIRYLLRQGQAIRGHDDEEGNFMQLLKLRSDDVKELHDFLQVENRRYTSIEIQNE